MIRVVHKIDKLKSSSVRIVEPKLICLDLVSIIDLNRVSIILFLRIISACVSIFFPKSLQFFQLAVSRFTYYFCVISDFPYFFYGGGGWWWRERRWDGGMINLSILLVLTVNWNFFMSTYTFFSIPLICSFNVPTYFMPSAYFGVIKKSFTFVLIGLMRHLAKYSINGIILIQSPFIIPV